MSARSVNIISSNIQLNLDRYQKNAILLAQLVIHQDSKTLQSDNGKTFYNREVVEALPSMKELKSHVQQAKRLIAGEMTEMQLSTKMAYRFLAISTIAIAVGILSLAGLLIFSNPLFAAAALVIFLGALFMYQIGKDADRHKAIKEAEAFIRQLNNDFPHHEMATSKNRKIDLLKLTDAQKTLYNNTLVRHPNLEEDVKKTLFELLRVSPKKGKML